MGKTPKGPPVLSLSASAESTSAGQTARLPSPAPPPVTLEDVPEFQDEARRNKQASQFQFYIQIAMVGAMLVRWFRGRNKPKPKAPRPPPTPPPPNA